MSLAEVIDYLKAHMSEIGGVAFLIYYAAKAIAAITPSTADDSVVSKVGVFLNWLATTLRFDPPKDPLETVPTPVPVAPVGRVVDMATGVALPPDFSAPRRPILRAAIKAFAAEKGLILGDAQLDAAVSELQSAAGPLSNIWQWIVANPEAVIAIIKAAIAMFASPKVEVKA